MPGQQAASQVPLNPRADFHAAMAGLQAAFATVSTDMAAREAVLKAALAKTAAALQDGVGTTILNAGHPLARYMTDFNAELAELLQSWLDRVDRYDRNTAFRSGFTDTLVVFVLGKVKAGKSSLGNYVAYGSSNPDGAARVSGRAQFFTAATARDQHGQADSTGPGGRFQVGARETTTSIQGFHMPGLTWIDSPGLHSATPENGALAADYVDVADLVVYPMHTGNPGRTGDVAEICELLRARKRFLAVITQCDRQEEDEEPDGTIMQRWVMKDSAARQGQIDHVRRAVAEGGATAPIDILSLSVRHAETHGNDPAMLEQSGVADFFRLLTDIACSEGVRRKREAPSRNLDHFVELMLGDDTGANTLAVESVRSGLDRLSERLAAAAEELDRRAAQATAAVLNRIGPMVADQVERHADHQDQNGFEQACTAALRLIVAEETRMMVLPLLAASGAMLPVADFARIAGFAAMAADTVRVPRSNRRVMGALGGAGGGVAGAWAGSELGLLLGSVVPGIGNLIGAGVGGALGALLGGFGGGAAGRALGRDWEETMRSGDNRADVEANAVKALQDAGGAAVTTFLDTLHAAAIAPVKRRATRLARQLEQFSNILATRVHSNGRSVPAGVRRLGGGADAAEPPSGAARHRADG